MIDIFVFILLVMLFIYFNNPTEEELKRADVEFGWMRYRNDLINIMLEEKINEKNKIKNEYDELKNMIDEMNKIIDTMRNNINKLEVDSEILFSKFIRLANALDENDNKKLDKIKNLTGNELKMILNEIVNNIIENAMNKNSLINKLNEDKKYWEIKYEEIVNARNVEDYIKNDYEKIKEKNESLTKINKENKEEIDKLKKGMGTFQISGICFEAASFMSIPTTRFVDIKKAKNKINKIVDKYLVYRDKYEYIFVIGHANKSDDPTAVDKSDSARIERNYIYAAKRAALVSKMIGNCLQEKNTTRYTIKNLDKILVIVSTGEYDLKNTEKPFSKENAFVEVIFGKTWKLPIKKTY